MWQPETIHARLNDALDAALQCDWAEDAKQWYHTAATVVCRHAREVGIPWVNAAYTVAALSPRCSWKTQLKYMPHVFHAISSGLPIPGPGTNKMKRTARACFKGRLHALSGPKVEAFAENLCLNLVPVTVDSHMKCVATGRPGLEGGHLTPKRHRTIQHVIQTLAQERELQPAEAQALIWCYQKSL